jgi:hypothetical protein
MAALPFSESFKNVIAASRLVALDLGCDYISTIHFFLADCQLHPLSSLKGLLFRNESDFQRFYQEFRVGPAIFAVGAGSVPLLTETDATLRRAKRVARAYQETVVHPCHFFVAATEVPNSIFRSLLTTNTIAPEEALAYYVRNGQLPAAPVPASTSKQQLSKLWRAIFSYRRSA